jgi:hypothetical protein
MARTSMIRRRIVTGALALFVATWMFIAVALISGRDPALASHTTTSATTRTLASSSSGQRVTTGSSGSASTGSSGSTTGSAATQSVQSVPSPVVTRSS